MEEGLPFACILFLRRRTVGGTGHGDPLIPQTPGLPRRRLRLLKVVDALY